MRLIEESENRSKKTLHKPQTFAIIKLLNKGS
jgi:hypothetical protein